MVKVMHEGGKELKVFETKEEALMWIGIHAAEYEIAGEAKVLRNLSIYVESR